MKHQTLSYHPLASRPIRDYLSLKTIIISQHMNMSPSFITPHEKWYLLLHFTQGSQSSSDFGSCSSPNWNLHDAHIQISSTVAVYFFVCTSFFFTFLCFSAGLSLPNITVFLGSLALLTSSNCKLLFDAFLSFAACFFLLLLLFSCTNVFTGVAVNISDLLHLDFRVVSFHYCTTGSEEMSATET